MRLALAASALLLLGQAPPSPDPQQKAWMALHEGRCLDAADHARRAAFTETGERIQSSYTAGARMHPFIGGVHDPAAIEADPPAPAPLVSALADRCRGATMRDAVQEIADDPARVPDPLGGPGPGAAGADAALRRLRA